MKLKLLFLAILAFVSIVAYQKYSEYSALKSIDSYESCATAKGSIIQESYPATCTTKFGISFPARIVNNKYDNNISIDLYNSQKLTFLAPKGTIFNDFILSFPEFDNNGKIYVIYFQPTNYPLDIKSNDDKTNVVVGGKQAIKSVSCGDVGPVYICQTFVDITISFESYLRIATILYDNLEFSGKFDQILSSFKFTN